MSVTALRILHLTAGSDAGGLSRYLFDLCRALRDRGHEVAVAGERGAWHRLFEGVLFPWIDVPLKGGPFALWRAVRGLTQYLEAHPVDVLHTHYRRPTLVARQLQRRFGLPILYSVHLSDLSLAWPHGWLSDFGDHTHVPSEHARRWVTDAARLPESRVTLIPHGLDATRFPVADAAGRSTARERLGLSEGVLVASYLGRLDKPKNEGWLVDLAERTRSTLPNLVVLVAGEGPHEAALRRRIAAGELQRRIRLLGHQDPLPVYHASDAVLLPSAREGFSLVTAEAMCAGVPVLRTRTAGTSELIVDGVTGRSCPIDHATFLAAAAAFLADRDGLRRMGRAAAEHVRAKFSFDRQVARTIDLYRRLATLRPAET